MMGESLPTACLRQLPPPGKALQKQPLYPLTADDITAIGRDPRCQITVDPLLHASVSRRHVELRPTVSAGQRAWWLCDLNSSNGTYLNGKRLRGCRVLQSGDRIVLGKNGPEYVFEYSSASESAATPPIIESIESNVEAQPRKRSDRAAAEAVSPRTEPGADEQVTFTQLFPIFSRNHDFSQKAYLLPGIITVGFVVAFFIAVGNPVAFNLLMAGYLALAALYIVYRICGKAKPWWILVATALSTVSLLRSPVLPLFIWFFRQVLPGQVPQNGEPFIVALIRMFFGAGLMEELFKAIPLLVLLVVGRLLPLPWSLRIGIWEPLDGILLGAASGVGFTLLETLGQYVPDIIQNTTLQAGQGLNELNGLHLLIARLLGSTSGHIAYSGYLGYFIGLSVMKPRQSVAILTIGYFSAAALHTLWNAMGPVSPVLLALIGGLSYAFLTAAILKARRLSPTRSQNFATRLK
jgi:RsiW-degrading membrane proteinase PrsW (M82 family)